MADLCIIPARGGSKRIPRKNIKPFSGKPIIAYAIQNAICSGLFSEVMVSTDDEEIAEISRDFGANVPFLRSADTSTDFATTADVLKEVLEIYKQQGVCFDNICCLYACTPLLSSALLIKAYTTLITECRDSVFPILPFSFPIQRALKLEETGNLTFIQPEYALTRSQDLKSSYHDAGQFYWMKTASFLNSGKILTENTAGIVIDEMEAQDIDNETDWKIAELKYKLKTL